LRAAVVSNETQAVVYDQLGIENHVLKPYFNKIKDSNKKVNMKEKADYVEGELFLLREESFQLYRGHSWTEFTNEYAIK